MDTTPDTWKCPQCSLGGSDIPPEQCPDCEWYFDRYSDHLTEQGYLTAIRLHQKLINRAKEIAKILDYGDTNIEIDDDQPEGTISTSWETYCGRGCCSPEHHHATFPNRYLWMSDEDIRAEEAVKKAASEAQAAEKKRKADSAQAEQELARAQARALTAQADAAAALVKAEATARALRGAP